MILNTIITGLGICILVGVSIYLTVLSVVIDIIEMTVVFDGIGQSIAPLVNVYRGEGNHVGIDDPELIHMSQTAIRFVCPFGLNCV